MRAVTSVTEGCVYCNICVKECAFLQKYGTPGKVCRDSAALPPPASVFECNLCGLCGAVCPKDLDVAGAFLEIRGAIQHRGRHTPATVPADRRHGRICNYERYGSSPLLSLHQFPERGTTVFFPGCTLAATRSAVAVKTYQYLRTIDPDCGIVLDCCRKPSHDLGLAGGFRQSFSRLAEKLKKGGVQKIITACPSCYVTFNQYLPECATRSVYEELAENPPPLIGKCTEAVAIHDPCTTRGAPQIHAAVRALVALAGARIKEMRHHRSTTLCCGEGAAAAFIAPELTGEWKNMRREEAGGSRIITYCAGCSSAFGTSLRTTHLLDLLFDHDRALTGAEQKTRPPFTYLNRLRLKWRMKRSRLRKRR